MSGLRFELVFFGLLVVSGLFFVLSCYAKRLADQFCVWMLLQGAFAMLAAVLADRTGAGAWQTVARLVAYVTCASAVAGAVIHLSALQLQSRMILTQSIGSCLTQLERLASGLDELVRDRSDRFHSVYDVEAAKIEALRRPRLSDLLKPPKEDRARVERLRSQMRYLDYSEQAAFTKIAQLLDEREKLLVHISPYLKRDYLLNCWCDAHTCLLSATLALSGVHLLTVAHY